MIYQVLIVDDEEIVCRGLKEFVNWKENGFEVADIAYSVKEALSILDKKYINVIFTDIKMPEQSGLDLLEIISNKYPDIKSVILSGHSDFAFAKKAIQYGASDYLTKPVNLKEVEELLKRIHCEITKDTKNAAIQKKRTESLLLSMAKGYLPYEEELNQTSSVEWWYGISLAFQKKEYHTIKNEVDSLKSLLSATFKDAVLLPYDTSKIFIIFPCHSGQRPEEILHLFDHVISLPDSYFIGISNCKYGLEQISSAFNEANKALTYLFARKKGERLFYKNIETLYEETLPDMTDFLIDVIQTITDLSEKETAEKKISKYLHTFYDSTKDLSQLQLICIRALIDIKSYLQNIQSDYETESLNSVLSDLMKCTSYSELENRILLYINTLIHGCESPEQQLSTGVIREIQLYINQHYGENISLQILANEFYLHPNYLSRLFKEKTGENFVDYLTRVRMNKVIYLLNNTSYKIMEICEMTGYDNPRYFSKAFKQFTGKTPREYRESKQ